MAKQQKAPMTGRNLSENLVQAFIEAHQQQILAESAEITDLGKLKIHLSQTYPLEEVVADHKAVETGSTTGKTALVME